MNVGISAANFLLFNVIYKREIDLVEKLQSFGFEELAMKGVKKRRCREGAELADTVLFALVTPCGLA